MVMLFLIFTVMTFFLVDWLFLQRRAGHVPAMAAARPGLSSRAAEAIHPLASIHPKQFALPAGLFFHPGHTWASCCAAAR